MQFDPTQRIQAAKNLLQKIRNDGVIPWWKGVFAENLICRAEEFAAVGRFDEWNLLIERLDAWFTDIEVKTAKSNAISMRFTETKPIRVWSEAHLRDSLLRIKNELIARKALIPITEKQIIEKQILEIEKLMATQDWNLVHAKLRLVRESWIRRLVRSYRAWKPAVKAESQRVVPKSLQPSGPYNARQNIENMVSLIGERDPIWVEDFMELYNDLLQYAERLTDAEKLKKKK